MLLDTLLVSGGVVWAFVTFLFVVSVLIKRNDIADVAWGPGIALASWSAWWYVGQPTDTTSLIVLGLISIWATRLGWRILRKNIRKGKEDPRYARWRDSWGSWFYPRSYLQVFLLQGFLMVVMSFVAVTVFIAPPSSLLLLTTIAGVTMWAIGFAFEVVGDYQLDTFLKNPDNKGRLMRYGLWKFSRHPNYFGEITMWWGLYLIAAAAGLWWIAFISPATITFLICFVSGIPLLEAAFKDHPEWKAYKRTTSVLIPWWPSG
jgi:steroid 5-alpha reductase family enzyme